MADDVTAVIPCFNYGRYLPESVESALAQAARVIVVDDGSTDADTQLAFAELDGGPVQVLHQENRGVCAARNAGLALVETPYAIVVDADDRLAPGALAAMRAPLESDPRLGFSYGWMRFFGAWDGTLRFPDYDPYRLLYRHTIGLSALMRRELVDETGGFDPAFEHYEDWELWVNALAHGLRGHCVDRVTLEYRRHKDVSKLREDRRHYQRTYRALQRKHAALYARAPELARESSLNRVERGVHRWFWGRRPVPAPLEAFVHEHLFRRRRTT